MTQRSERRKAELAVIEAARNVYVVSASETEKTPVDPDSFDLLLGAIDALDALGLEEPAQTRTSGIGPVTSHLAAAYMHGSKVKTQTGKILRHLSAQYPGHGWTTDELVIALGKPHQSISARINELRDAGWIADSSTTRKTRSNQDAAVWTLTEAARHALGVLV